MTGWVKIMNVSRFIKDDIKRSLIHNRYRIILCVFIVFGLMAAFYKHIGVINSVRDNKIQPSVCDYILYMTRGICRVTEENITRLEIPYVWISLCIMCGLMVLDYMYSDMRGMGKNVLVRRQCLNMKRRHAEFFCLFKCFLFGEHAIEVRELVKSR